MRRKEKLLKIEAGKDLTNVERAFTATVIIEERMKVGGCEGIKSKLTIENPRSKERPDVACEMTFVSKKSRVEHRIADSIKAYHQLRKLDLPVPNTTRICISKEDSEFQLVMTDMTENGKYILWGYSNFMHSEQYQTLRDLNLTEEEIDCIEQQANEIAYKAAKAKHNIRFYNYHLRKNLETGIYDVVLLDIGSDNCQDPMPNYEQIMRDNLQDVQTFKFYMMNW